MNETIRSIPEICEVARIGGKGRRPAAFLLEVPHGATTLDHYTTVRNRLRGALPDRLEEFYFVNTDVGAPECAHKIAELIVAGSHNPATGVLVVRSLVPRTFIDCNRAAEIATDDFRRSKLTPALPEYIVDAADAAELQKLYDGYQSVARAAYDEVCGGGGLALTLHTYAPKSVGIHTVDATIVRRLHEAYRPPLYDTWEDRPEVDLINRSVDGANLAPETLVSRMQENFKQIGIEATESRTYQLHPATMAYRQSVRYPQQVLCLEISRGLLADPFTPFRPMRIAPPAVERMSVPIAEACLHEADRAAAPR